MTWIIFISMLLGGLSYILAKIIANKIDKWVKDVVKEWNQ